MLSAGSMGVEYSTQIHLRPIEDFLQPINSTLVIGGLADADADAYAYASAAPATLPSSSISRSAAGET